MSRVPHLTRCRVCGCTQLEACNPPCGWADRSQSPICTGCATAALAFAEWLDGAHRANLAALKREALAIQDDAFRTVSRQARGLRVRDSHPVPRARRAKA
jgi:hypothetical protein